MFIGISLRSTEDRGRIRILLRFLLTLRLIIGMVEVFNGWTVAALRDGPSSGRFVQKIII